MYLLVRHLSILRRKRIDRRGNELLIDRNILAILREREDGCVILFDELAQIGPYWRMRRRKIDVTLPEPWHLAIAEMGDQRQRLRIVHDDRVAIVKMKPRSVL